jgi:hypothetical protein
MAKLKYNLADQIFGEWTVLRRDPDPNPKHKETHWICLCSCGNIRSVMGRHLLNRSSKSCHCTITETRRYTYAKMRKKDTALRAVYYSYKYMARKRALLFEITLEDFKERSQKNCYYCGASPATTSVTKSGESFTYNGIDRLDSATGYTEENMVTCCRPCNIGKMSSSASEYIERCRKVAHNHAY